MPIYALDGVEPAFADPLRCWIAPNATLVGRVRVGLDVSIWFNAVLRGDTELIDLGDGCNIQDGAMLHADQGSPTTIGAKVTVGHHAIIHGASVGDGSLIGMGATVLNRAGIGASCLVGANALVTEGKVFPPGSMIMGAPAKLVRPLIEAELAGLRLSAEVYIANGRRFAAGLRERVD